MCCTTLCCGPRTGSIRSQGLSIRNSIATAHSNTARMRCRNRRAVSAFVCQMGATGVKPRYFVLPAEII